MTTVTEAVLSRRSIRSFLDRPVDNELIKVLIEKSSLSPSGGNLQPWQIYIINNESMSSFHEFQKRWSESEHPEYPIYPEKLKEPYRTSRYEVGEQIYSSINIKREDKVARVNQMLKNFDFFNAPAALFCFIDKQMSLPQWSDLGMFLQTFMLLAKEAGLDTCAQEAWSMKHESVSSFVHASSDDMLFCGMSIGYQDQEAPINKLISARRPLEEWTSFL